MSPRVRLALSALVAQSLIHRGRSYGLELMVRHPLGANWFGWISYSLQHSERLQRYVHFDEAFRVGFDPIGVTAEGTGRIDERAASGLDAFAQRCEARIEIANGG